jgi:uncharacterized membrane protein
MTAGALALGLLVVTIDRRASGASVWIDWVYGGGADGARAVLSAVAGSAITVVSLTFSITIVALTVSSQHFGPRLLSNFMRDTAAQVVLGMFVGTFAYCLVVLRTVRGEGEAFGQFIPHMSVTVAVVLALLSVVALIYYLHHVAASMQVSHIALNVTRDLEGAIDRLYPEDPGGEPDRSATSTPMAPDGAHTVAATSAGYVQAIDLDAVVELGRKHATTVWLQTRPGDFVIDGMVLASVSPTPMDADAVSNGIRGAYVIGIDRTSWQDAEFAVQQLVEVTLHALSPGINEPFTALTCIDRLGQALSRLAARHLPSAVRTDATEQVRLVAEPKSLASLLGPAFDPIILYAAQNPAIYWRLLETLAILATRAIRPLDRVAIREQAAAVHDAAVRNLLDVRHRHASDALYARVTAAVGS